MGQGLGTVGYLTVFACSVAAMMVASPQLSPWTAGVCLLVAVVVYPRALWGVLRLRWLLMVALLSFPAIFLVGVPDRSLAWFSYSSEGLSRAIQIALRMLVVLISIQGLTLSVDVSSIAGLLERAGLHGLGFSVGVAVNLLPALHDSAQNAWRSLWMRGGLRKQFWRSLRLLVVTVIAGALSHAEEVALAAEMRAFSPERARGAPVRTGKWDYMVLALGVIGIIIVALAG